MMHENTLRGTHTEMGKQDGAFMAQIGLQLPQPEPELRKLAEDCEQIAIQYVPNLVDEMRAFADAAHVSYDTLKTMMLAMPLQQNMPSCSVVAVLPERSATDKLMVGRNYDFTYGISWDSATTYQTYPTDYYPHIGNSDIWIGREDGLNDAGLFVAISATLLPGVQSGLPFWFIVRHLLETCATVEEALQWIGSIPHSQSRNYMLADPERAVVVEATINGIFTRKAQNGLLTMTNHLVHPIPAAKQPSPLTDSLTRYERLSTWPNDTVALGELQTALNDREYDVCAHGSFAGQPFGTIWSVLACPEDRQFAVAQGTGDNHGKMSYRNYTL